MAIKYTLRCPACAEKFSVLDAVPRFCPLCGHDSSADEAKKDIRLVAMLDSQRPPSFRNSTVQRGVDDVYNAMEAGSGVRARMAADMLGVSEEETSGLKITNLRDNSVVGEDAAVPLNNPVTQAMSAAPTGSVGHVQADPNIAAYKAANRQGVSAGSGLATMQGLIQNGHQGRKTAWEASGKHVK